MTTIRNASLYDLPGGYRVCLATGDAGRDASGLLRDPDLLGHIYVGPYIVGQPDLAFVVADEEGVAGYCLGALDTQRFDAWKEEHWWPALRRHYLPLKGDSEDAQLIRLIHEPPPTPAGVLSDFPSHLHIDLLERMRGQGVGRAMVERLMAALAAAGSPAVHLEVAASNADAIGFYRRLGFSELEKAPDSVFMGRSLSD